MIEIPCPHCQRVLKVPEKYVGTEGACNYCGGRVQVAMKQQVAVATVVADPTPAAPVLDESPGLQARLTETQAELAGLAAALEDERAQREKAESDRDAALARVAELETTVAQTVDRAELDRVNTELDQSRERAESSNRELEAKRAEAHRAESRLADVRARLKAVVDDLSDMTGDAVESVPAPPPSIMEADAAAILVGGGSKKHTRWARLFTR